MVLLLKQQQQKTNHQLDSLLSAQLPFSQTLNHLDSPLSNHPPCSPDYSSFTLKSNMNSQLLCTQALLESNGFKLLAYDKITQIKNTISKLEKQLSSLNSKFKLELKILRASHLLQSDHNSHDDLDSFSENFNRLYDQRESIQSQISDLRTLLFQHISAALALGYKKLEHLLNHPSHPHHTQLSNHLNLHRSPSLSSTRPSSRSNRSTTLTRFDGPHMFASDQTGSSVFSPPYHQSSPESSHPPASPTLKRLHDDQTDLYKEEIDSLKALIKTKDAIIAEKSSDIVLLELEVETMKQSLSDQSSNYIQRTREQSTSQADSQIQIEALQSQNSQLIQALQSSADQLDSTTTQIDQLKLQVDQLNSELANERSQHGNRQQFNDGRLKEAENRATAAESSHDELKSREIKLQSELDSLRAQSISKDQSLITREALNNADWEFLIDRLLTLNFKLHDEQTKASKLAKLFSQLSSPPSRLELLNDRKKLSQELVDSLVDYMTMMDSRFATVKSGNDSSNAASLNLEKLRRSSNQEISELMVRLNELELQNEELKKQKEFHKVDQEVSNIDSTEVESLKLELATVKQQLAEKESSTSTDQTLQELWKLLPPNLDSRVSMNLDNDLSQLKALYESPKKASVTNGVGGLGGLFGLGRRAATPTTPPEDPEFSVKLMLEKICLIIENDKKLIDRLIQYEAQKDSHKNNSIRAKKLVTESQEALRIYQSQVKELEERLEYANTQSAAMLEKVNDLMGSEERSNMVARRAELNVQKLQSEIESLQLQLKSSS